MVSLKKSAFKLPVGLVNARKPLGHSGQRKLQAVVGSKLRVTGIPHTTGFRNQRVRWYEIQTLTAFHSRAGLCFLRKLQRSFL